MNRNSDWVPVEQTFRGVAMVLVPPGCFMMGSRFGEEDEEPVHEVCFSDPFWVDKYEVTNAQFTEFGGSAANVSYWPDPLHPRSRVTWEEANSFCALRGASLPTEAQWEYAARGPDALAYPWGKYVVRENVVSLVEEAANVGSRPGGVSWVEAYDLSGNVWEWVADWYGPYTDEQQQNPVGPDDGILRVLRGGAYSSRHLESIAASGRESSDPTTLRNDFGFRCVLDVQVE